MQHPLHPRTSPALSRLYNSVEEPELLSSRDVLEFATIEAAHTSALEERTGSLTPGKQADVVVVRCDHSNTWPVIDPVSTVVHQADTRNIDTVIVAGEFLKRDGRLVHGDLRRARDDAVREAGIEPFPHAYPGVEPTAAGSNH